MFGRDEQDACKRPPHPEPSCKSCSSYPNEPLRFLSRPVALRVGEHTEAFPLRAIVQRWNLSSAVAPRNATLGGFHPTPRSGWSKPS